MRADWSRRGTADGSSRAGPPAHGRAPDHALRRPRRHRRSVVLRPARGEITAIIGPNGAGKTTVFNCITGFYKPTSGRMLLSLGGAVAAGRRRRAHRLRPALAHDAGRRRSSCWSACPTTRSRRSARVARTFQNIRLFPGMTVLENLIVAQHNALMAASGWTVLGLLGAAPLRARPRPRPSSGPSTGSTRSASPTAPTIRPAICPTAPSGGSRSRAPCAPSRCCCASTSRRPASTRARSADLKAFLQVDPGRARHLDPADRARHVGGDGDLRPRRRARVRQQDLGRPARARAQRSQGDRRLPRRRGRGGRAGRSGDRRR